MSETFPTTSEGLYTYFGIAIPYLVANKTRFGIDTIILAALTAAYGDNATAGTYFFNYALWANKLVSRTSIVSENLDDNENDIIDMLMTIYDDIPATIWTTADRKI